MLAQRISGLFKNPTRTLGCALLEGIERILHLVATILRIVVLAYPLKHLWNEYVANLFALPTIGHIDQAIAILSLLAIAGSFLGLGKRKL